MTPGSAVRQAPTVLCSTSNYLLRCLKLDRWVANGANLNWMLHSVPSDLTGHKHGINMSASNQILRLTLSTLGKIFSRQHIEIFFVIFPRKHVLVFHANCLQCKQFAWNVKFCFLRKIRKLLLICGLLNLAIQWYHTCDISLIRREAPSLWH